MALWAWIGFPRLWARSYDWHDVAPNNAHFRVVFPGVPTESEQTLKAVDGQTFVSYDFRSQPAKGVVYAVNWWENPLQAAQTNDEIFEQFRRCGIKVSHMNAAVQKDTTVHGYPAKYTVFMVPQGQIFDLSVRVGPRVYSLLVLDPDGLSDSKNIRKFFGSFSPEVQAIPATS